MAIEKTRHIMPCPKTLINEKTTVSEECFPIIKKRFFGFPYKYAKTAKIYKMPYAIDDVVNGNPNNVAQTDVLLNIATMTQISHEKGTKIDITGTGNDHDIDNVDVIRTRRPFDNELKKDEQTTLNLKDEGKGEGDVVLNDGCWLGKGEPKEIEHQQAENFNDAFSQRMKNNDDDMNDATNAAKNISEICELATKSEAKTGDQQQPQQHHNELYMTKAEASKYLAHKEQQQSICLAKKLPSQTIDVVAEVTESTLASLSNASNEQQMAIERSDARQTSPEQVDYTSCELARKNYLKTTTNQTSLAAPPELLLTATRQKFANIEFLKCAVREFLSQEEEGTSGHDNLAHALLTDIEFIDLLSDVIDLIATSTSRVETGNLLETSVPCKQVASECPEMTLTKVGEESETAAVAIEPYADQIDEAADDLNNNNNINNSGKNSPSCDLTTVAMKYDLKPTTITRPHELTPSSTSSTLLTSRIRDRENALQGSLDNTPLSASTSRMRDVTPMLSSKPMISDLRRSSTTSRDESDLSRLRDVTPLQSTKPKLSEPSRSLTTSRDESDVESVLPERTRLRRQRRMRSQDSAEEKPEDVIERLNKLKARISGALSEVKGVLKQYSTESESETSNESKEALVTTTPKPESEPVQFRFVKKIRRRSCFNEEDEYKEQADESTEQKDIENKDKEQYTESSKPTVNNAQLAKPSDQNSSDNKPSEQNTCKQPLPQDNSNKSLEFLDKVKKELTKKPKTELEPTAPATLAATATEDQKTTATVATNSTTANEGAEADDAHTRQQPVLNITAPASEKSEPSKADVKARKKIIVKKNSRRASIAAVEGSKIESPVESALSVPQRRPSDSEAIVKRKKKEKLANSNKLTSGSNDTAANDDVTPKLPIPTKLKRSSLDTKTSPTLTSGVSTTTPPALSTTTTTTTTLSTTAQPSALGTSVTSATSLSSATLLTTAALPTSSACALPLLPTSSKSSTSLTLSTPTAPSFSSASPTTTTTSTVSTVAATSEQLTVAKAKVNEGSAKFEKSTSTAKISDSNKEDTTKAPASKSDPLQLPNDIVADSPTIANQTPTDERNRRASLVLAELVGETVLVSSTARATANSNKTQVAAAAAHPIKINLSESKELINQAESIPVQAKSTLLNQQAEAAATALATLKSPQQVVVAVDIEVAPAGAGNVEQAHPTPQIAAAALSEVSPDESSSLPQQQQQPSGEATKDNAHAVPQNSVAIMPELKVLAGPVQPVKIDKVEPNSHYLEQPSDGLVVKKKTTHLKKLVRKNSIDKEKTKEAEKADGQKLNNILKDKNKIGGLVAKQSKVTPPKPKPVKAAAVSVTPKTQQADTEESATAEDAVADSTAEELPAAEPEPKPKKPRKIKKKVIIKRQKRKLSIGDTFFLQPEPEEPKVPEIETIEKAIAYVTDDDDNLEDEPAPEPPKPLKSCMHVHEYKIGDLVLYAERFRKTQVKWKRGRVLERITSISYKLEIEGKDVAAHISYIKKYTGRKVKFGNKEYLEIDYEQVAEEERRALSYSIWNMV